ncbi:MAG: hypothetical protein QF415_15565 [Candidatus Undinarchaeales archaeon]|jgi:hypothetical protein|nr:hypothetical protein [Candidatus Undinarchaeales archaeon]MDP7493791.1 hypothetical protein [Candidatus Undinarchaeales archaeon]
MAGGTKLSFVYSMLMVSIFILTFLIASRFVDIEKGGWQDFLTLQSANTIVITYLFFILLISAVALGFAFLFFRIDTIEEEFFERQDTSNNILRAIADDLRTIVEDHKGKEKD